MLKETMYKVEQSLVQLVIFSIEVKTVKFFKFNWSEDYDVEQLLISWQG